MGDAELLQLAADMSLLTDQARVALDAELRRRNLEVSVVPAEYKPPPHPTADDNDNDYDDPDLSREGETTTLLVDSCACPLCSAPTQLGNSASLLFEKPVCRECYSGFSNRRYLAFLIDYIFLGPASAVAWLLLKFPLAMVFLLVGRKLPLLNWVVVILTFLLKDGFRGYSLGKALVGVRVVDAASGQPIGFAASCKRNLPLLIPFAAFFVALQLRKGNRIGDGWARTRVVWKKYGDTPVFHGALAQKPGETLSEGEPDVSSRKENHMAQEPLPPGEGSLPLTSHPPNSVREREITFVEPTPSRVLKIMWAWYWRYIAIGLGSPALFLFLRQWEHQMPILLKLAYFLLGLFAMSAPLWAYPYAFRIVLNMTFKTFRIGFAEKPSTTPPNFLAPTLRQVRAVWWAFTWRSALWGLACVACVTVLIAFIEKLGFIQIGPNVGTPVGQTPALEASLIAWFLGHVAWLIASVFVLGRILRKEFRHFQIRLVSWTTS